MWGTGGACVCPLVARTSAQQESSTAHKNKKKAKKVVDAEALSRGEFALIDQEEEEDDQSYSPFKAQHVLLFSAKAFAIGQWAHKEAPQL